MWRRLTVGCDSEEQQPGWAGGPRRCEGLCGGSGWWGWELGDRMEVRARLARVWKA